MNSITCGIYKIENRVNKKIYVGSSANTRNRMNIHFEQLRKGKHPNRHLQCSFNKYGKENFSFVILETCHPEKLLEREQYYMDKLHPEYNIRKEASSNKGLPAWNKGISGLHKTSEETKRKLSTMFKGRISPTKGMKFSDETKRKISESGKKHYIEHPERKEKVRKQMLGNKYTLGYRHSEETKAKISKIQTGRKSKKRSIAIKKWWSERKGK